MGDSQPVDYEGPQNDQIVCSVGKTCHGDECEVDLHAITVHADVSRFWNQGCVAFPSDVVVATQHNWAQIVAAVTLQQQETTTTTSTTSSASSAAERTSNTTDDKETFQNNSTFHHNVTDDDEESLLAYDVLLEELNPLESDDWTTTTDTAQNGNYTIQFRAGWSVLFKNPEFWYDNFPDRCHPEKTSTISISCHAHGQNEQQYQQATIQFLRASSDSIQCNQTAPGTLECYEAFDRYQDIVNQFTQVVYVRLSLYFFQ